MRLVGRMGEGRVPIQRDAPPLAEVMARLAELPLDPLPAHLHGELRPAGTGPFLPAGVPVLWF